MLFAFLSGFLADFLSVAVVVDEAFCAFCGDFCFTVLSLAADFLLGRVPNSEQSVFNSLKCLNLAKLR